MILDHFAVAVKKHFIKTFINPETKHYFTPHEEPFPGFKEALSREKKPFSEFRRESGDDELTLIDQFGREWVYDLTDIKFGKNLAKTHDINLNDLELERMIDYTWSFGIVIYWHDTQQWEIL